MPTAYVICRVALVAVGGGPLGAGGGRGGGGRCPVTQQWAEWHTMRVRAWCSYMPQGGQVGEGSQEISAREDASISISEPSSRPPRSPTILTGPLWQRYPTEGAAGAGTSRASSSSDPCPPSLLPAWTGTLRQRHGSRFCYERVPHRRLTLGLRGGQGDTSRTWHARLDTHPLRQGDNRQPHLTLISFSLLISLVAVSQGNNLSIKLISSIPPRFVLKFTSNWSTSIWTWHETLIRITFT